MAMSTVLRGLALATNSDPSSNDEFSLKARALERRRLQQQQEDAAVQDLPFGLQGFGIQSDVFNKFNRRNEGGFADSQWLPFFEALQESGERNGPGGPRVKGLSGLPTDRRTVEPSLQGLRRTLR